VEVLLPDALAVSDPFVLLMDDRLDIARRRQIGGPHPHAGLETVTFVLEGTLHDRDEGELSVGDVLWMNAGRGIIHNESVEALGRSRILQLWVALPAADRGMAPEFELVRRASAPSFQGEGVEARVYSGASNGVRASTRNRAPVTMVDIDLGPNATFTHDMPADYNGFGYVLEGECGVGDTRVTRGDVAWVSPALATELRFTAGSSGARVVLYTGRPNGEPLVQHGPFVAGSLHEIAELNRRFRAGRFTPMSALVHG